MLEIQNQFSLVEKCRARVMCRRLYYVWRSQSLSHRERLNEALMKRIRTVHADSRQSYSVRRGNEGLGCRRVHWLMRMVGSKDACGGIMLAQYIRVPGCRSSKIV